MGIGRGRREELKNKKMTGRKRYVRDMTAVFGFGTGLITTLLIATLWTSSGLILWTKHVLVLLDYWLTDMTHVLRFSFFPL